MIEPGIAGLVVAAETVAPDWSAYRPCPVCKAPTGASCTAMHAHITGGRPGGPPVALNVAHARRRLRALRQIRS